MKELAKQYDPSQVEDRICDLAGQGNSESNNYWFEANYNSDTLEWEIIG